MHYIQQDPWGDLLGPPRPSRERDLHHSIP